MRTVKKTLHTTVEETLWLQEWDLNRQRSEANMWELLGVDDGAQWLVCLFVVVVVVVQTTV